MGEEARRESFAAPLFQRRAIKVLELEFTKDSPNSEAPT
jgi:hypothetical protein